MCEVFKIIEASEISQKAGNSKYAIICESVRFDYVYVDKYGEHFTHIEQKGYENLTQYELRNIYLDLKKRFK